MEEYIKSELIGGKSPRYLDIFQMCLLFYPLHITIHFVLLLLMTGPTVHHDVDYKIARAFHILLTTPMQVQPMQVQKQLPSRTWQHCTGEHYSRDFGNQLWHPLVTVDQE